METHTNVTCNISGESCRKWTTSPGSVGQRPASRSHPSTVCCCGPDPDLWPPASCINNISHYTFYEGAPLLFLSFHFPFVFYNQPAAPQSSDHKKLLQPPFYAEIPDSDSSFWVVKGEGRPHGHRRASKYGQATSDTSANEEKHTQARTHRSREAGRKFFFCELLWRWNSDPRDAHWAEEPRVKAAANFKPEQQQLSILAQITNKYGFNGCLLHWEWM